MQYDGEYVNDLKHGIGTFTWSNGKSYTGEWFEGKQHGLGALTSGIGKVKMGRWKAGKLKQAMKKHEYDTVYAQRMAVLGKE